MLKYDTDLLEVTMLMIIREMMNGHAHPADLMEKVSQSLSQLGITDDEIFLAFEAVFGEEHMAEAGLTDIDVQLVIFDGYDPARRIPLELIQRARHHEDPDVFHQFREMIHRRVSMEQFELSVEIGDRAGSMAMPDWNPHTIS